MVTDISKWRRDSASRQRLQVKKHVCLYVYVMDYLYENSELLNVLNLYINLLSRAEFKKWSDSI